MDGTPECIPACVCGQLFFQVIRHTCSGSGTGNHERSKLHLINKIPNNRDSSAMKSARRPRQRDSADCRRNLFRHLFVAKKGSLAKPGPIYRFVSAFCRFVDPDFSAFCGVRGGRRDRRGWVRHPQKVRIPAWRTVKWVWS